MPLSLNDVLILGGLIAAVMAGLLGIRRGDTLRTTQTPATPPPFALVGPTLADSQLMQRQLEVTTAQTQALEKLATALGRIADQREARQSDRLADVMQRLTERLDETERRPRR